jgi:hypothetical protein
MKVEAPKCVFKDRSIWEEMMGNGCEDYVYKIRSNLVVSAILRFKILCLIIKKIFVALPFFLSVTTVTGNKRCCIT